MPHRKSRRSPRRSRRSHRRSRSRRCRVVHEIVGQRKVRHSLKCSRRSRR